LDADVVLETPLTKLKQPTKTSPTIRNGKEAFWMPFTNNRVFKAKPTIMEGAKGMMYFTEDGRKILDGASGLWCVNAGHCQPKIVEAIQKQAAAMDYSPAFNMGHKKAFQFAEELLQLLPDRKFGQVFFTVCGSSAVETALKIALAYHRGRGDGSRVRFIGREKGYHGVGFGGISVGGLVSNRKAFSGNTLPYIDHLPHTHSLEHAAFSRGLPSYGAHLADDLERLVALHDASNIAAVIVEPVQGSAGVIPPPTGYLRRLRDICTKHGILLIFDEVITGFGRLGSSFGTTAFDVTPDLITCAKGLTNGAVPAGAVICQAGVYDSLLHSASKEGATVELMHGYTYSGHPLAMAAGLATLEVYREQQLFQRALSLAPHLEDGLHSLRPLPNVIDIRNCGLMGAVELSPVPGHPTKRGLDVYDRCFAKGLLTRTVGSIIALAPALVAEREQLDTMLAILAESIEESAKAF